MNTLVTLGSKNLCVLLDFEWRTLWFNIMSVLLHFLTPGVEKMCVPGLLGEKKCAYFPNFCA